MSLEPEQLAQILGAASTPAAALAFEAPVNLHFDILFNDAAASTHRSELAIDGAMELCRNGSPVIDAIAVAQDVTKERVKLPRPDLAVDLATANICYDVVSCDAIVRDRYFPACAIDAAHPI